MSRTIRMIGVDLDGTLLNSEKQLTAYTREVLKKAIEQERFEDAAKIRDEIKEIEKGDNKKEE